MPADEPVLDLAVRAQTSAGALVTRLRDHVDREVRLLTEELVTAAAEARQVAETRAVADAEARAVAATEAGLSAVRAEERHAGLAAVSRLVESFRTLDRATSLVEVLDALASQVAAETSRVAVLLNRGSRLRGWRLTGFGDRLADPTAIDIELGWPSLAARAARTSSIATSSDVPADDDEGSPGFVELPEGCAAMAVPVQVGGEVVAVVYADNGGDDEGERGEASRAWPEAVEALTRHASRCLEALTALKAARLLEQAE